MDTEATMKTAISRSLIVALVLFAFAFSAEAAEYKVIFLTGLTPDLKGVEAQDGYHLDRQKTETLNELTSDGWKLIAVTGAVGADHALYLCRNNGKKPDC